MNNSLFSIITMLDTNFTEVKIFDDELSELEILKKLTAEIEGEEPLHMLNIQDIFKKHQLWLDKMPRIVPYYGISIFFKLIS